jgi:hypothetical protein
VYEGGKKEKGLASLRAMDMSWGGFRQAAGWQSVRIKVAAITSHVFLALKHHEAVAAVGLLFLVALFVGMRVTDDADLSRSVSCP